MLPEPTTTDPAGQLDIPNLRIVVRVVKAMGRYFRHTVSGLEHVPDGPTLVVGNHSGGKIPIDTFLFCAEWYEHFHFERPLYALMHDALFHPVARLKVPLRKAGCVKASWENAREILESGHSVIVLPGGDYETYRPFRERNRIDFAGRTGFIRVALETGAPITPVVQIGGHEILMILFRGQRIAKWTGLTKLLRVKAFPISLGLPGGLYVGPVPSPFPLPSRITTRVLPPVHLDRAEQDHPAYRPADAGDPVRVRRIYEVVTGRMQAALTEMAAKRRFPVFG